MTIVRVAIPLKKGKRRFHLDKGRPWSAVEHAVLVAVARQPRRVRDLAAKSRLPRRLILEILIRLMRAGWVVLDQKPDGVEFLASRSGLSVVDFDYLPNAPKRIRRWMTFLIDQITGTLYRSRELVFFERHVLQERSQVERIVWLEAQSDLVTDEPASLVSVLFDDDEKFVAIEPAGDRLVDRYALITVRDGNIEGLPTRSPPELAAIVMQAASTSPATPAGSASPTFRSPISFVPEHLREPQVERVAFKSDDLIIGGEDHETLLEKSIRNARSRIVVHSTFISRESFERFRPALLDAARKGVQIDILWGEDGDKLGWRTSRAVVEALRGEIESIGVSSTFRLHPFSTYSHAKILIADDPVSNRLCATVGSCNWLSSGFESFEVSVRLRDPKIVSVVLAQLADMTLGSNGHWTDLTNEFVRLSIETCKQTFKSDSFGELAVVLGPQHADQVRIARDTAKSRLFVTSHRLGPANRPAVIVPAIAAAEDRGIQTHAYYGVESGVDRETAADLARSAAQHGVVIRPVKVPRLHAKVLGWDDDHLVVTSQNWLSADPSESNFRREIGVAIHASAVGRIVREKFEFLRRD